MGLLSWFRRRKGEGDGARRPAAQPVDVRFRADLTRFEKAPAEGAAAPAEGSVVPREDPAVRTFTTTTVTVNGREVDPSDPRAAPLLAALRDAGGLADAQRDPAAVRRLLQALSQDGLLDPTSTAAAPPSGIAERLAELEKLRAAGLVTEAEYAAKRKQLLDAL